MNKHSGLTRCGDPSQITPIIHTHRITTQLAEQRSLDKSTSRKTQNKAKKPHHMLKTNLGFQSSNVCWCSVSLTTHRDKAAISGDGTNAISKHAVVRSCAKLPIPLLPLEAPLHNHQFYFKLITKPTRTVGILLSATAPAAEQSQFTLTNKNHAVRLHCPEVCRGKKK